MLYEAVEVGEEIPVQYAGIYVLKWQEEWGMPDMLFKPVEDPAVLNANELLSVCEAVAKESYPDSDPESLLFTLQSIAQKIVAKVNDG